MGEQPPVHLRRTQDPFAQERVITTLGIDTDGMATADQPIEPRPYRIVLVEDDRGDALLVEAVIEEHLPDSELRWFAELPRAAQLGTDPDCVLVDLGLPGSSGLEALEQMLSRAADVPVIVLTGLNDRSAGLAAVAAGAADYLVKGVHDGAAVARAIGFAVERSHASLARLHLHETEMLRAENVRLERGLLPRPLLTSPEVTWALRYRPGAGTSVLGGDFLDMVERPDGAIRLVVGDVCGHGPDEAALGVCLRIAWRTLVMEAIPDDEILPALDRVLLAERQGHQFSTVCDMTISPDRHRLAWRLAGHPPPILLGSQAGYLSNVRRGVPLGVQSDLGWRTESIEIPEPWGLLVFTDGVFEPLLADGTRLDLPGLLAIVAAQPFPTATHELDTLLEAVQQPHLDAGHPDDLAVLGLLVSGT